MLIAFSFSYKAYTSFLLVLFIGFIVLYHEVTRFRNDSVPQKAVLRAAGNILAREGSLAVLITWFFALGIMQLLYEPATMTMVLKELQRYSNSNMDPVIRDWLAVAVSADFLQFIVVGLIKTVLGFSFRSSLTCPSGAVTLISLCFLVRHNTYMAILLPCIVVHLVLLRWVVTSYGTTRYILLEIILSYCFIGGFISFFLCKISRNRPFIFWAFSSLIVASSISIFYHNFQDTYPRIIHRKHNRPGATG